MIPLIDKKEVLVRFPEVDSMRIVWHGHYLKYFEDGRESFGLKYNLGYLDVYRHEVMVPLVKISCDYKRPLEYGDTAVIETRYVPTEAAKIVFHYNIYRKRDMEKTASGSSTQVFLNLEGELLLTSPGFYLGWKRYWGLLP